MNVFVTGGCGYKGSILVPKLLERGHHVHVLDIMWFGNFLTPHPNLKITQGDVRNLENISFENFDAVIHLSSVANDPCSDLDPKLTWEISALATMQLADKAVRSGIKHFIYASSGSVYGIKEEEQVTEDLELKPLTEYNKTKMVSERVLMSYADKMAVQIIRPATVCGCSPRMRLDVSVNMLTMQAIQNKRITVFGGKQVRPNIHIDDIAEVYLFMLENKQITGIFNAGFENISILEIAHRVQKRINAELVVTESNDPRSYHINSDKLLSVGFRPRKTVDSAIDEMIAQHQAGKLQDLERWHNLKWMQKEVFA